MPIAIIRIVSTLLSLLLLLTGSAEFGAVQSVKCGRCREVHLGKCRQRNVCSAVVTYSHQVAVAESDFQTFYADNFCAAVGVFEYQVGVFVSPCPNAEEREQIE